MTLKRLLIRETILAIGAAQTNATLRRTPARHGARWAGNHIVPWLSRSAYSPDAVEVNGVLMRIPRPPDWGGGGEFHMVLGTYERDEIAFLRQRLKAGDVFIDVGAHIGYYTLPAALAVGPTGSVIAVEATQSASTHLREHLALNQFPQVQVFEVAASDHDGQGTLSVSSVSGMWNTIEGGERQNYVDGVPVTLRSLDSITAECGFPQIAGIKVDVEGAEAAVLSGAVETLRRNPQAFIQVEMQGGERTDRSMKTLTLLDGYALFRFARGGRLRTVSRREVIDAVDAGQLFNVLAARPDQRSGLDRDADVPSG